MVGADDDDTVTPLDVEACCEEVLCCDWDDDNDAEIRLKLRFLKFMLNGIIFSEL